MFRSKQSVRSLCLGFAALVLAPVAVQAQYTGPVEVETTTFGNDPFAIGSLSVADGALPTDLWAGASADHVDFLLDRVRSNYDSPASMDILRRTLLSPGNGPAGADLRLTAKKLMVLAEAGFYEEAASLAELSAAGNQPEVSQAIAYADMMRGDMADACRRGAGLTSGRNTPFWLKLRLLCYARNGEQAAADLTLGLLRDQNLLEGAEADLFTAIAIGSKPRGEFVPRTGFEYAAIRQLELPLPLEQLDTVDGSVLRALAGEAKAPRQARVYAAERAHHLGIMSARAVREVFSSIPFEPERIATAKDILVQAPDNYLVDALVYQAVEQMTSGELTLDRAALVGEALRSVGSYERFAALAEVYAPLAQSFEVIVNYAPYAREFALAGIVSGDMTLADRWISALATNQTTPEAMDDARRLLSLLSIRNPGQAQTIAGYAGLQFETPQLTRETVSVKEAAAEAGTVSGLVRIMLETSRGGSKGQAALLSLVAEGTAAEGELGDILGVVRDQARQVAGLDDVGRDSAFRLAVARLITSKAPSATITGRVDTGSTASGLAAYRPRVKPDTNG